MELLQNPATGRGGTTGDGMNVNGYASTWASFRSTIQGDGAGGYNYNMSGASWYVRALKNASGYYGSRMGFTFDTSSIPVGSTITSAVFSVYGQSTNYVNSNSTSLELVGFNPANKGAFVDSDWTTFTSTTMATGINFSSLSQSGYNDFTLNVSGIANINKGGISCFGLISGHDLNNIAPTGDNIFQINMADFGSNKPKLVVNYVTSSGVNASILCALI